MDSGLAVRVVEESLKASDGTREGIRGVGGQPVGGESGCPGEAGRALGDCWEKPPQAQLQSRHHGRW